MRQWQLQEAKNKLSELIMEAERHGPQIITRRGTEAAIVIAYADYHRMQRSQRKLSEFFRNSPLVGVELDLTRDESPLRNGISL
jgi:prevent-host-death family protein